MIITAETNKVFRRIHDGFIMGSEIHLGYDYSTGKKRLDLPKYYDQINEPEKPFQEQVDELIKEIQETVKTQEDLQVYKTALTVKIDSDIEIIK